MTAGPASGILWGVTTINPLVPTVNLNGTPRQALEDQWTVVHEALQNLQQAVAGLEFHGRDYAGPEAWAAAQDRLVGHMEAVAAFGVQVEEVRMRLAGVI